MYLQSDEIFISNIEETRVFIFLTDIYQNYYMYIFLYYCIEKF